MKKDNKQRKIKHNCAKSGKRSKHATHKHQSIIEKPTPTTAELNEFTKLADTLNLDYLIEVHDADELKRIENFDDAIVGINNRNLKTFKVNLENSITLRKSFNKDNIFISESGIQSKADIEYLQRNKISYYLIGESLMRNVFN